MSAISSHSPAVGRAFRPAQMLSAIGRRALAAIGAWRTTMRQRGELMMLNEVELRELSLTAADVARESTRPFWDSSNFTGR